MTAAPVLEELLAMVADDGDDGVWIARRRVEQRSKRTVHTRHRGAVLSVGAADECSIRRPRGRIGRHESLAVRPPDALKIGRTAISWNVIRVMRIEEVHGEHVRPMRAPDVTLRTGGHLGRREPATERHARSVVEQHAVQELSDT
jgi:hypothetical protein